MLGIPPTPEETKAFVEDKSEDAWGTLVNQVLDSPLYGERFASLWLDLIRSVKPMATDQSGTSHSVAFPGLGH